MELINTLAKACDESSQGRAFARETLLAVIRMLAPITPHLCRVLWGALSCEGAVIDAPWPQVNVTALMQDEVEVVVQVNGKLLGHVTAPAAADQAAVLAAALGR